MKLTLCHPLAEGITLFRCVDSFTQLWCAAKVISTKKIPPHRRRIGYAIRARRDAMGVSQEQFAEYCELHRNYIGLVERGLQNLTVESLVKISRSLKCKPSDILIESGL